MLVEWFTKQIDNTILENSGKRWFDVHDLREVRGGKQDKQSPASLEDVGESQVSLFRASEDDHAHPREQPYVDKDQDPYLEHRHQNVPVRFRAGAVENCIIRDAQHLDSSFYQGNLAREGHRCTHAYLCRGVYLHIYSLEQAVKVLKKRSQEGTSERRGTKAPNVGLAQSAGRGGKLARYRTSKNPLTLQLSDSSCESRHIITPFTNSQYPEAIKICGSNVHQRGVALRSTTDQIFRTSKTEASALRPHLS